MNFGEALEAIKKGYRVARKGWNGKKMCIFLTKGSEVAFADLKLHNQEALACARSEEIDCDNTVVRICDHIDMIASDGSIVIGWLASQTDMLAEDWEIVQ
jgi:hypothetical protein